jgi:hypothetical protein
MPLEVPRLLDSDLVALSTGDEFKAAFILWAKSWSQLPAASIPDDDRILAKWVGFPLSEWLALREMALRGWVLCTDGRLYHPVVADLAISAQAKRKGQAEKANSRWAKVRAAKSSAPMPPAQKPDASADAAASETNAGLMQGKGTVEEEPPLPPRGPEPLELLVADERPDLARQAFDLWNDTARRCGLPLAEDLTDRRRKAITKRLESGGLPRWRKALDSVEHSKLCRGLKQDSTWRANIDFVCSPSGFQKLVEGTYARDAKPPAPAEPVVAADPLAELRRRVDRFKNGSRFWNTTDWGPQPGRPGCTVAPAILAEFGFTEPSHVVPITSDRSVA